MDYAQSMINHIKSYTLSSFGDDSLNYHRVKLVEDNKTVFSASFLEFSPMCLVEGSLNSKLPTIWRGEKQMKSREMK